jgi:predicted unusual protein kinase regulating ubiquinone biosynthesis (AarF/ABC1/UbiB family)
VTASDGSGEIDRKARVRAFRRLFLGLAYDFWRQARLIRRQGMRRARQVMAPRHRKRAIQFRETAAEMGGVLIKLGQFLSARADVMPEEYLQELSQLQDEVPPVPFGPIKDLIEREFGRPLADVFPVFEPTPVAAASLGQVHEAALPDGTLVAVKVQRPGIEELVDVDLATFAWLMEAVERFTRFGSQFDIPGLVAQFAQTLSDELDFLREGSHAERLSEDLADSPFVYVPAVHWEYTTTRVLTLERIAGIKISDYDQLEAAGVDRHVVADEVFQSYMQQILGHGFFHADPHPGNLFVVPPGEAVRPGSDGSSPTIEFVDFGMVGEITARERELFQEGVIAGSRHDFDALLDVLVRLGFIRPGSSLEPIKRAIEFVFATYSGMGARHVDVEALESLQEDVRTLVYEQPFTLPAQFGFLGRAVGTLIGLVSGLDPQYDFVSAVRPYVHRVTTGDPGFVLRTFADQAVRVAQSLAELPGRLDTFLERASSGQITVRSSDPEFVAALRRSARSRRAVALSIWATGLLVGGVALFAMGHADLAAGFAGASVLVMIAGVWLGRERRGPHNPHGF